MNLETLMCLKQFIYFFLILPVKASDNINNVLVRIMKKTIFFIAFKNPIIIIINLNQNLYYHTIKKSSEHTVWINTTDTTYSFYLVI